MRTILCGGVFLALTLSVAHAAPSESPLTIEVAKQAHVGNDEAHKQIELVVSAIKAELLAGREVTIRNFGKFYVQELGPRQVRNPKTGEKLQVDTRRYPRFSSSDNLKDEFNPNKSAIKTAMKPASATS